MFLLIFEMFLFLCANGADRSGLYSLGIMSQQTLCCRVVFGFLSLVKFQNLNKKFKQLTESVRCRALN